MSKFRGRGGSTGAWSDNDEYQAYHQPKSSATAANRHRVQDKPGDSSRRLPRNDEPINPNIDWSAAPAPRGVKRYTDADVEDSPGFLHPLSYRNDIMQASFEKKLRSRTPTDNMNERERMRGLKAIEWRKTERIKRKYPWWNYDVIF